MKRPSIVIDGCGTVWHRMSTGYYRRAKDKAGREVSFEFIRDNYGIKR